MDKARVYNNFFTLLKRMKLLKLFMLGYIFIFFYLKYRVKNSLKVVGKIKINWNQPLIIIANHSAVMDFYLAIGIAARKGKLLHALVSEGNWKRPEYFEFLKAMGMIPRMGSGAEIVDNMVKVLDKGHLLLLAPEGTISKGLVSQGFTGFVRVYFKANRNGYNIPILPCFIHGTGQAYPKGINHFVRLNYPRKNKIRVQIGQPFHMKIPENVDKETLRKYADHVMLKIARMGGQKKLYPNPKLQKMQSVEKSERKYQRVGVLDNLDENF